MYRRSAHLLSRFVLWGSLCLATVLHGEDGETVLRRPRLVSGQILPAAPQELVGQIPVMRVTVGMRVTERGEPEAVEVIGCADDRITAWLKSAVGAWRFEPVIYEGRAVSCRQAVEFILNESGAAQSCDLPVANFPDEEATQDQYGLTGGDIVEQPRAYLALPLRWSRGEVAVAYEYLVEADGWMRIVQIDSGGAESPRRACLEQLVCTRYEPPRVDGRQVQLRLRGVMHLRDKSQNLPEAARGVKLALPPVYPRELLLAGTEGNAVAEFSIGEDGAVSAPVLIEATHPEFGRALLAALPYWRYDSGGGPRRRLEYSFSLDPDDPCQVLGPGARRALALLKEGAPLARRKDLDQAPAPAWTMATQPPEGAQVSPGEKVRVECLVDRAGLVHLPKVLKASTPEVGASVLPAVANWRFEPAKRKGRPVDWILVTDVQVAP